MESLEKTPQRSSQFGITDFLLLTLSCAFACGILMPFAPRGARGPVIAILSTCCLTMLGTAISFPIWRYLIRKRLTVLAVNHLGYLLPLMVLAICWDDEVWRTIPLLASGPLSFFGYNQRVLEILPVLGTVPAGIFIIVVLTLPITLLMATHTFRPNLIGVIMTSLGTALWYFIGVVAALSRIY